jgi:hypothetical protein
VGQNQRHLVATVAGWNINLAGTVAKDAGYLVEDHIALRVPMAIVDRLEVVDVEHDQRQPLVIAPDPLCLEAQQLLDATVVAESGESSVIACRCSENDRSGRDCRGL